MDKNLSSEKQPTVRPIKPIVKTLLTAAEKVNKTDQGSAVMVRDTAGHVQQLQDFEQNDQ